MLKIIILYSIGYMKKLINVLIVLYLIFCIFFAISSVVYSESVNTSVIVLPNGREAYVANNDYSISIVSPQKSIGDYATLNIQKEDCSYDIPYIQTDQQLNIDIVADNVPAGGGIRVVVGKWFEGVVHDTILYQEPYSIGIGTLGKGEYTVNAYLIDSDGKILARDFIRGIGIGDIIFAIGDSITVGTDSYEYTTDYPANWLEANRVSEDGRNFDVCGDYMSGDPRPSVDSYGVSLNDKLINANGYPVYIHNMGVGSINSYQYLERTQTRPWQDMYNLLDPNIFIIHLGNNDSCDGVNRCFAEYSDSSILSIANSLDGDVYIAKPILGSGWGDSLISFDIDLHSAFVGKENLLVNGVHPNQEGQDLMSQLYFDLLK